MSELLREIFQELLVKIGPVVASTIAVALSVLIAYGVKKLLGNIRSERIRDLVKAALRYVIGKAPEDLDDIEIIRRAVDSLTGKIKFIKKETLEAFVEEVYDELKEELGKIEAPKND